MSELAIWQPMHIRPKHLGHYWLLNSHGSRLLGHWGGDGKWRAVNAGGETFKLMDYYTHWAEVPEIERRDAVLPALVVCQSCESGVPKVKIDMHTDGNASWPCVSGRAPKVCVVSQCPEPRVPLSQYCSTHMPRGAAQ